VHVVTATDEVEFEVVTEAVTVVTEEVPVVTEEVTVATEEVTVVATIEEVVV
jgi:hypothetical protein